MSSTRGSKPARIKGSYHTLEVYSVHTGHIVRIASVSDVSIRNEICGYRSYVGKISHRLRVCFTCSPIGRQFWDAAPVRAAIINKKHLSRNVNYIYYYQYVKVDK